MPPVKNPNFWENEGKTRKQKRTGKGKGIWISTLVKGIVIRKNGIEKGKGAMNEWNHELERARE